MYGERGAPSRFVTCPHCGLPQKVTFMYNAVSVEQRCIGCYRYAWFRLPSFQMKLISRFRNKMMPR